MKALAERLRECQQRGELTTADLAHWFDRPFPTVRLWVMGKSLPREPAARLIYSRLGLLEARVALRTFPINMSAHARPTYIKQVRENAERGGVSTGYPA